jgi:hypothetical protein
MENKKILSVIGIIVILITVIGFSYAFFQAQSDEAEIRDVNVITHTVDTLTFSATEDIEIEATQFNFINGGVNQSGDATATAILTPNSKTGAATKNYNLYLNITDNDTVYSAANTNQVPELLLQVFNSSNQLVILTELGTQKTVGTLTGYDITGVNGLITLLNNHAISASNNTSTTENWRVVVTLINHNFNQNDNTGKTFAAELIIRQDEYKYTGTIYRNRFLEMHEGNLIFGINNQSVYCVNNNNYNECDYGTYYLTYEDCQTYLETTGYVLYGGYSCEQETRSFPGIVVGEYKTTAIAIASEIHNVYCPIGGDYLTCGNNRYYSSEEECTDEVNPSVYTCTAGTITKPYYIKNTVSNNSITGSQVCLWYNNHEFCLESNYWDTNAQTTKNKLQTAMETTFGTQADSCNILVDDTTVRCTFGYFFCDVDFNGIAHCGDTINCCAVYGNSSGCSNAGG